MDKNGLYGDVEFYKSTRALGFYPIIGVSITTDLGQANLIAENNEATKNSLG